MEIGERIREVLKDKNIKQIDLEKDYGVSQKNISAIIHGRNKRPALELIQQIAQALGMTVSELIGEVPEQYKNIVQPQNIIPVLGTIRAGLPILAQDNWEEEIEIPGYLNADFALRVTGDSMSWIGIQEGDLALMEQSNVASHGSIVAAGVEDGEWKATLKFFVQENGCFKLRAANPEYEDIVYTPQHRIIGRLLRVVKESPSLQDYKSMAVTKELSDQAWEQAIEKAIQNGLDGERVEKLIELFSHMVKKV